VFAILLEQFPGGLDNLPGCQLAHIDTVRVIEPDYKKVFIVSNPKKFWEI
jgi:hypothetical protein